MLGIDVFAVAEIESRFAVEHDAVTVEQILVEFVKEFLIARQPVHLRHHRHHHVECVGPPPIVVVGFRVGLIAHHLLGACHSFLSPLSSHLYIIKVNIGLETNLPVAEEHVVLSLTVGLVFPFAGVSLARTLPLVVLGPFYAIVEHLLVLQQFIHLYVSSMIGCIVPERAHFRLVVLLPVGVHLPDYVPHLGGCPFPRLQSEGRRQNDCQ